MASYNQVNGCYAGQNPELLGTLKDLRGWEGFVAPDFMFAVRDPVAAARAGLDLPGLDNAEGRRPDDFTSGRIGQDRLDDMVTQGLLDRPAAVPGRPAAESLGLAAEAAVAGSVLLVNRAGALPLGEDVSSLAVIGPAGPDASYVMGGSPAVKLHSHRVVTPLAGIRQRQEAASGSGMLKGPGVMCRFRRSRQPSCPLPWFPAPRPAQVSWPSMSTAPARRRASASPGQSRASK
jgi:beta-glucosidase